MSTTNMSEQSDADWVTHYYRKPEPERFVEEVTRLGEASVLELEEINYVVLSFLSKIFADNPERVRDWFDQLQILKLKRWPLLFLAASYSRNDQVESFLEEIGFSRDTFAEKSVLEQDWGSGEALDMLWGYFFASGEVAPIRRIISAFELADDFGAAERFAESKQTKADEDAALRDAVFQSAMWSLESNCSQHPLVLEHCERIVKTKLTTNELTYLVMILSKLKPDSYSIEFKDESGETS